MDTPDEKGQSTQEKGQSTAAGTREASPPEYAHIKGWGIDADPNNNPTYPMKKRVAIEHDGYSWERPAQQPVDMEIHYSIERPGVSAVFGTASPPRGLSGMLRRWAFNYSEDQYHHWVGLLAADRIDMVEGVLEDLAHGHIPNLVEEKGLHADWEYDRERLLGKVAIGVGIAAAAYWFWQGRSQRDNALDFDRGDDDHGYALGAQEYYEDYDSDAFYGTNRPY